MISKKEQILMLIMLTFALNFSSLAQSQQTSSSNSLPLNLTKHPYLEIISEEQLQSVAISEGWSGSGTTDDPIIIEKYFFDGDHPRSSEVSQIIASYFPVPLGFNRISLVISNVDSFVVIRNNQFAHAVIINRSPFANTTNLIIEKNTWITDDDPNNLLTYASGVRIRLNHFDGSNFLCEEIGTYLYSRIFVVGEENVIERNVFEIDKGCTPLSDILFIPPPARGALGYLYIPTVIKENYFKSCYVAIASRRYTLQIVKNDFDTGKFALFTYDSRIEISNNNFRISELGVIGQQKYDGTEYFFTYSRTEHVYESGGTKAQENYYSNWTGPDTNHDGIVDNPYVHASGQYGIIDLYPSTTPISTYYFPINDDKTIWQQIALGSLIFATISGISYFYLVPWISRQRKIYNGALLGNTKAIISELFDSQTILYYSLIGQSKIEDKEIEEKISEAIPTEIYDFKYLLHPVRMSIVKLLYENLEMTSIELKEIMRVSWNDYSTHSASLKKQGYIHIEEGFVDGKRRQLLTILPKGTEEFKNMMDLMHLFFDNSVDYAAYIKSAQQKLDASDPDLYPNT